MLKCGNGRTETEVRKSKYGSEKKITTWGVVTIKIFFIKPKMVDYTSSKTYRQYGSLSVGILFIVLLLA